MRWLLAALCLFIVLQRGFAQGSGPADPAFAAAYQTWLSGDEAQSLPALAALAASGNPAARVLLGVIDTNSVFQGAWLMQRSRAERIALMRAPGGISGLNWLREMSQTDPVAATWLKLWDGAATTEVILEFARLKEPRAARLSGLALAARQKHGFDAVANDLDYPASLHALAIQDWRLTDPGRARQAEAALAPGDPQTEALTFVPKGAPEALAAWLAVHPEGDPALALCEALCPSEPADICHPAAYRAIGGYYGLMRLGAPVEALTPSHAFNRSPMGLATIRRMAIQQAKALKLPSPAATGSACLDSAFRQ